MSIPETAGSLAKSVSNDGAIPTMELVGSRIRARREAIGISLRQFARNLDVSASFISQLETGKTQPSVATLFAICNALGLSTDELFDVDTGTKRTDEQSNPWRDLSTPDGAEPVTRSGDDAPVIRPHERKALVLDSGVTWESLAATHSRITDFMHVRYEVGGTSTLDDKMLRHVGTEYGYILKGTLEITLGFETYTLHPGDSISFDSSRPHRLANVGNEPVEAVWFNLHIPA